MNEQIKLNELMERPQHVVVTKSEFLQAGRNTILNDRIREFGPEHLLLEDCFEALVGIKAEKVREFIQDYGISQLPKVAGALDISEGQRTRLLLLFESFRRLGAETKRRSVKITSAEEAAEVFKDKLSFYDTERFYVAFLNNRNILIKLELLAKGSITEVVASPALILKRAVCIGASSVLLGHNHPSGVCSASQADKILTTKIKELLSYASISLLDHVIISDSEYLSFKQEGYL